MDKEHTQNTTTRNTLLPESIQNRLNKIRAALAAVRDQGTVEMPPRRCPSRKPRRCFHA